MRCLSSNRGAKRHTGKDCDRQDRSQILAALNSTIHKRSENPQKSNTPFSTHFSETIWAGTCVSVTSFTSFLCSSIITDHARSRKSSIDVCVGDRPYLTTCCSRNCGTQRRHQTSCPYRHRAPRRPAGAAHRASHARH